MLKINTIHCAAKHFVTTTKNSLEQIVLLIKQFIYPLVGTISFIDEIDYNYIILLPITMTTAYALFHSLWVPRKVEIYEQRTELKIDTFTCRFSSNHYLRLLPKIIY